MLFKTIRIQLHYYYSKYGYITEVHVHAVACYQKLRCFYYCIDDMKKLEKRRDEVLVRIGNLLTDEDKIFVENWKQERKTSRESSKRPMESLAKKVKKQAIEKVVTVTRSETTLDTASSLPTPSAAATSMVNPGSTISSLVPTEQSIVGPTDIISITLSSTSSPLPILEPLVVSNPILPTPQPSLPLLCTSNIHPKSVSLNNNLASSLRSVSSCFTAEPQRLAVSSSFTTNLQPLSVLTSNTGLSYSTFLSDLTNTSQLHLHTATTTGKSFSPEYTNSNSFFLEGPFPE